MRISLKTFVLAFRLIYMSGIMVAGWFLLRAVLPPALGVECLPMYAFSAVVFLAILVLALGVNFRLIRITCPLCGGAGGLYSKGRYTGYACKKCGVIGSRGWLRVRFYRESDEEDK